MTTTTGDTINGSYGELDFTALPYTSGATTSYNTSTGVLTVTSGSRYESLTLNNPGTNSFLVGGDGKTGTAVTGVGSNKVVIASQPAGAPVPMAPTDTILTITFDNDPLSSFTNPGTTGVLSGSAHLDLTTGTSSGFYSFVSNGATETFTNPGFLYNENNSGNTDVGGSGDKDQYDTINFTFSGNQPTSLSSFILIDDSPGPGEGVVFDGQPAITSSTVCFARGTRIAAVPCERAVEQLVVGDIVVTASGAHRPIRWLGHRTIDCRRHPRPTEVMPIRIAAHAFADGRPSRDLLVSPGHAIAVDVLGEVLIPAGALVNGATITQETVERITYWHVELDSHDLLLAEDLPAESYLDNGNRAFFSAERAVELHGSPDTLDGGPKACRPLHRAGSIVAFVRQRLIARAEMLEWRRIANDFASMHLIVDGRRVEPRTHGLSARFLVPAGAKAINLVSDTSIPALLGINSDARTLGICLTRIVVEDGFGASQCLTVDDFGVAEGFHAVEPGPQRWTGGNARLPADLLSSCHRDVFLRVDLARPALPRWQAPSKRPAATFVAVKPPIRTLAGSA